MKPGIQQQAESYHTSDAIIKDLEESQMENEKEQEVCRICLTSNESNGTIKLVSPCFCSGPLKYAHEHCMSYKLELLNEDELLSQNSDVKEALCEICRAPIQFTI